MITDRKSVRYVSGLMGAVVGGVIGYFAFFWLVQQGLYAMVLPGALIGLGCGAVCRGKSNLLGGICLVLAIMLGIFTEWEFELLAADISFVSFITHLHEQTSATLVLIAVGGGCAFWFGRSRDDGVWKRTKSSDGNDS